MTTRPARPFRSILSALGGLALASAVGCSAAQPTEPPTATVAVPAATEPPPVPYARQRARIADLEAVVATPDRSAEDRALDGGRRPVEMLQYFEVRPGMRVAELGAGMGYTAELLARTVGTTGKVYAQNPPLVLERFAEKPWSERLQKPALANVVRLDRPFDDPLPPEVRDLDGVYMVLFYHDTVWMKADRARMNRAVFDALRPGGIYGIIDHAAAPGAGLRDVETLHRIEESVVISEILEAGFRLEGTATFLRNPADTLDWNPAPRVAGDRRGESDRFVLLFRKP
jgi:predicted methyltransferase